MICALFGTPEDRAYLPKFQEILGSHGLKVSLNPETYLTSIALKVRQNKIEAIICTSAETLIPLLQSQPDFRRPVNKNGALKNLTLDDYAGSCFTIPAAKLGAEHDVRVLILNPLAHLVRTPEGSFIFKRFVSKITKPESWFPQTAFSWEVWKPSNSAALLARFSGARLLAVDIETYVGDVHRRVHCVGYAGLFPDGSTHTVVVPFKDMLAHQFVRNLNLSAPPKIFQNGMYDNLYFLRWNVPCNNWLYDTQHLFHSWYAELPKRLDFITAFTVRDIRYWKDDAKTGGEYELFEYNARDCWATLTAWCSLINEVPTWALDNYRIEFPLVFPCLHMEADGLRLDPEKFRVAKAAAVDALAPLATQLAAWIGPNFNPNSSDQCVRLLKVLGIKDAESAGKIEMIAAAAVHPLNERVLSTILAYRKQAKLLSTYFVWEKFWNERLYYKTNPAGTDSGRLASTESSFWTGLQIQNIPQGKAVKAWIMADADWDGIAEGDYAQSEARCVGYKSGCEALIALVESDKDYHSWNAHKFFGVRYEEVTKDLRNLAKRVNHGANYNMGAGVLLNTMGPRAVAEARRLLGLPGKWSLTMVCQHLLRTYEQTYPEVKKEWYDQIKRTIKLTKKLVSEHGWTRWFFNDPSNNKMALNSAVAHGPQNLSAGTINTAFYQIWRDTVYGDLRDRVRLKANIHDSILFLYRGAETPEIVRQRMIVPVSVTGVDKKVRTMVIPPDMSIGQGNAKYWADLK